MPIPLKEDRTKFIGGSDVAAILGHSPYRTPMDVWTEKMGQADPFEGNAHTRRGTRLEEVAAEEYTERTGIKLARVNERISHPQHPFITARIDRRIVGQRALAEIKCPSLGSFSKLKRTGLGPDYICQMLLYLGLMEFERGEWILFCADQWELQPMPIDADPSMYADIVERLVEFWERYVVPGIRPPATNEDVARLEFTRVEGTVALIDKSHDADFIAAAQQLREAKALKAEADLLESESSATIKALATQVGVYVGPEFRLSLTETKGRASFDKESLKGAKPLDRLAVDAVIQSFVQERHGLKDGEMAYLRAALNGCSLDLAQFEKTGRPFTTLRATFYEPKA